jgi:hypothetical protein
MAVGRLRTLAILAILAFGWLAYHSLAARHGWPCFDPPPFVGLKRATYVVAALLWTLILVNGVRVRRRIQRARALAERAKAAQLARERAVPSRWVH